jgi:hypothetical protein
MRISDSIVSFYFGVLHKVKAENTCLVSIIQKYWFNIILRINRFQLFKPSIPAFHYSIIPCGIRNPRAAKRIKIPTDYRYSEILS